jgi:hypothetical protein
MGYPTDDASDMRGPVGGGTYPLGPDRLAGTTGEDSTPTKLRVGVMATILVGAQPIRFSLRGALEGTTQVATTDPLLPAFGRYDWVVASDTCVVYVESSDATTAYECWVWQSSPGRA